MLLCRFLQIAAAVLFTGTAALRLLAWGTGLAGFRAWNRLAWGCWSVLLVAGVVQLGLTAAAMSGLPLAQALSGEVLGRVLDGTSFGAVWRVRAGLVAGMAAGLIVGGAAARRSGGRPASAAFHLVNAGLAAVLLANLVWAGHAHASRQGAWLLPTDVAHVLAAGAWPGGLFPLWLLLTRARRDPTLVRPAVTVTRRFSRLSMAAVGTLALTGLLNSYGLVGTLAALWPGVYGRLLLCKVTFFAGMVGLGAVNRRLIGQTATGDAPETLRRLQRNVAWECVLAVIVLLATEALAMNAPPAT